ncbi:hypothetical protein ULMS_15370 [Patiriisocius marinistellae]|uniref:DUF1330 domain-containing protein n=1 Tax=Patiriisocius marinistellae TaxID=2494560 RepID=A0A5J4G0L0_9FLAO|nr:hypothetical protein [Patiriisocius marinistellae]GEQ86029.1 hypothetical protein ULMS_15370 [Patiriisocius marinistellae]
MTKAYLEISLNINDADRANAAGVYSKYKAPFLETIKGATSKELLIREEDVQVLHGFKNIEDAQNYLTTTLFTNDVVTGLKPYLKDNPEVKIYKVV